MENMPVVDGAIIVCEGGDNKELVNDITNAVYGLLNIPVHKIKVMKMS
jgi:stage III sporulation protein AG